MITPLLSKINKLENEVAELKGSTESKSAELEKIMISQEETVGFILNSLQNLTSMISTQKTTPRVDK